MSLIQLLAVGRSLRSIKDRPSPYKMAQRNGLLRFGGGSIRPETAAAAAGGTGPPACGQGSKQRNVASALVATPEKVQMNRPETEPAPAALTVDTSEPKHAYPLGRWTVFKNPFSRKPLSSRAAAPAQGELSLDTLKVVRNDLSDADLEIVRATEPVTPAARREPPAGEPVPTGLLLSRLTARIFGRT